MGFQVYDHDEGSNSELRRADVMVDRSLALIDEWGEDRFFLVVHLFDPHLDYDPPEGFRGRFTNEFDSQFSLPVSDLQGLRKGEYDLSEEDHAFIEAAYDEEIAFVDHHVGRLLEGLEARGLLDRSLLVLTSDHGEEFFEHGGFEHGHAMWQELLHVPLLIWGPGVVAGQDSSPVSLVDIAPTVLDWVGLPTPADIDGRSLWPRLSDVAPLADRKLFAEQKLYGSPESVVIEWPLKVVANRDGWPSRVFDLDADPAEQTDLSHTAHLEERVLPLARTLLQRLQASEQLALQGSDPASEVASPSDDTLERLRSLGYIR